MMRIAHEVWSEEWLFNGTVAAEDVQRRLGEQPSVMRGPGGSHSYHIITRDREGNIASGTITAQSDAWGDGIFVDSLALPTAGRIP